MANPDAHASAQVSSNPSGQTDMYTDSHNSLQLPQAGLTASASHVTTDSLAVVNADENIACLDRAIVAIQGGMAAVIRKSLFLQQLCLKPDFNDYDRCCLLQFFSNSTGGPSNEHVIEILQRMKTSMSVPQKRGQCCCRNGQPGRFLEWAKKVLGLLSQTYASTLVARARTHALGAEAKEHSCVA